MTLTMSDRLRERQVGVVYSSSSNQRLRELTTNVPLIYRYCHKYGVPSPRPTLRIALEVTLTVQENTRYPLPHPFLNRSYKPMPVSPRPYFRLNRAFGGIQWRLLSWESVSTTCWSRSSTLTQLSVLRPLPSPFVVTYMKSGIEGSDQSHRPLHYPPEATGYEMYRQWHAQLLDEKQLGARGRGRCGISLNMTIEQNARSGISGLWFGKDAQAEAMWR